MNEETIIENRQKAVSPEAEQEKRGGAWKHVTLGGVSGILMGAGLMYAGQVAASTTPDAETVDDAQQAENTSETPLPVAQLHNDLSFGEAFAAARAELGPGGVFIWHGGIYNTYTSDEWNAMTPEQKNDFAHQVNPEVRAHEVPTPTDAHPDVAVQPTAEPTQEPATATEDVQVVDQQTAQNFEMESEDVHIVGYASVDGHLAVGYDTTGDGQADVAIIDMNDNHDIDDQDVIMDNQGHAATVGEVLADAPDPNQIASMENPDVAADMPDYMNDAALEA